MGPGAWYGVGFRQPEGGNPPRMDSRGGRKLKRAVIGPVLGALVALAAYGVIAVITSGASIWWWISAAVVGAIGGFVIAELLAAEQDDGEIASARTAKHPAGDADAPLEGAERRDVGSI
jgi:membrane associated rhomboid family serine protease